MVTTNLKIAGFSLLSLFIFSGEKINSGNHKFHVSKCLIEYQVQEKSLQISLHIFIDDLEIALENLGATNLHLCTAKENPKSEEYLFKYLKEKFKVEINRQPVDFQWIGKEISDDLAGVWCYMEVSNVEKFNSLQVANKVLLDIFDDQKNIVRIKGPNGKEGFLMFAKGDEMEDVKF